MYIYIVQSADMHVSAFYGSSVQLGVHIHIVMWVLCIYTRELALTKRTRYNTTHTYIRGATQHNTHIYIYIYIYSILGKAKPQLHLFFLFSLYINRTSSTG